MQWRRISRVILAVVPMWLLPGACGESQDTSGWLIAYHELATDRIASCDIDGRGKQFLTPDSLRASLPAADSTGAYVLFVGTARDADAGPYALYRVNSDGRELERLLFLPLRPISLTVSPGGRFILFGGKYDDEEHYRLYLHLPGTSGFKAVVPADRTARDPSFSRSETNFIFDLDPPSDTGWIGFTTGDRPLPLYGYEIRQGTFHPSGEWIAGLCDPRGNSLCQFHFRSMTDSVIVQPEAEGVVLANPTYCPDGTMICYAFTTPAQPGRSKLATYVANSLNNNKLKAIVENADWPAWIRSGTP